MRHWHVFTGQIGTDLLVWNFDISATDIRDAELAASRRVFSGHVFELAEFSLAA